MIAMSITLVVLVAASALLAGSFNIRGREDQRTAALADAQRALNTMSREIANSGFGLTGNGIVTTDSTTSAIRFRANLNALDKQITSNSVADPNEDVRYSLYSDATNSYIMRLDVNTGAQTTVLANRVDSLRFYYFADKVNYTNGTCAITLPSGVAEVTDKRNAKYIVIVVCVELQQQGAPGSPGYQPPSRVQLVSDITLRNADLYNY
ncbi:MAG: hypothetical protein H0V88_07625 [Pyrinomonadaceae bacterium]|nr:hypothetical protein [Pyrinomonadaceae bacterium]